MSAVRIGLDIGGTKVHGIAADAVRPDEVLADVRTPTVLGPAGVVATTLEVVKRLVDALPATTEIVAVGAGIPGAVDADGILTNAVNLDITEPLDLRGALASALGVPVTVNNDVNAAARGVATWLRSQGEREDVALLSVGTGLAAGFVLDGRLRRGAYGVVGEVGHLSVVADGPRCTCGQHGCIELYASGRGLARQWPYVGPGPQPVAVFDAADAGDERAIAIRETFVHWLCEAIRIVALSVDPARVVLTGGVMRLGERIMEPLFAQLDSDEAVSPFVASLRLRERIVALPVDYPAAALGAAELATTGTHEPAATQPADETTSTEGTSTWRS
ncbi:ROK family protein [Mumia zhuanghuii]|uniref:ROK family protein n=2 Tax=Mumia TaxID=1546255 RepID=A0ABW1QP63_9ACTN|nr:MULTISPECIES: ROK family protein [Mumia]KAA1420446.1 ROK family protein [Mumia zhuanghuii]